MTSKQRTGLRIPYKTNVKLTEIALKMGISKNAIILQAIYEYLEKHKEI